MRLKWDHLLVVVRWGGTILLLGILFLIVDLREVYQSLRSATLLPLSVALVLSLGDRLLMAGKWFPLLRVQVPEVRLSSVIRVYFAAGFANTFLPASGGDVLRSIGLGRGREAVLEVGASVVIERILGIVGSALVAVLVLWVALRASLPMEVLLPWVAACIAGSVFLAAIPFSARVRSFVRGILEQFRGHRWVSLVERFGKAYSVYTEHKQTLFAVGLLSTIEQFAPVFVFWVGAQSIGLDLPFSAVFIAVPLTFFVARLPISVAGIGVIEGGFVYLFGLFDVTASQAVSLAIVGRAVELVTLIPGAFWWKELVGAKQKYEQETVGMPSNKFEGAGSKS